MIAKYKKRAENILNFMKNLNKPLSRTEILHKFREGNGYPERPWGQGINNNENALRFLVENKDLKKFESKTGRVMFSFQENKVYERIVDTTANLMIATGKFASQEQGVKK
jgi:hypothetical protein